MYQIQNINDSFIIGVISVYKILRYTIPFDGLITKTQFITLVIKVVCQYNMNLTTNAFCAIKLSYLDQLQTTLTWKECSQFSQ